LGELRTELAEVYAGEAPVGERRRQRAAAFDEARASYASLRAGWTKPPWFDNWFDPGLNNARLAALSSYEDYVPAFRALLAQEGGNLERFYGSVAALGERADELRQRALQELLLQPAASFSGSAEEGSGCPGGY
jgi:predicted aminopeptidase